MHLAAPTFAGTNNTKIDCYLSRLPYLEKPLALSRARLANFWATMSEDTDDDDEWLWLRATRERIARFRKHHSDTDDMSDRSIWEIIQSVKRDAEEAERQRLRIN